MNKYIYTIALILFGYLTSAQTINTDRPDQTESSSTIGKAELQLESGILFGTAKDDFFSEEIEIKKLSYSNAIAYMVK